MLAALLLMGIATVVAAPVLISSMSVDDVDEIPPEPDEPTSADLLEGPPEFAGTTFGLFDETESLPGLVQEPLSRILAPVSAELPDISDDDLDTLDGITPIAAIKPELADIPEDDLGLPTDQILQPIGDTNLLTTETFPLVANLDDTIDDVGGPEDVAQIWDFVPGEDILDITIFTELPPDAVTIEVVASEDGQDSIVTANDQLIAVLRDAPDAALGDIVHSIQLPLAS